MKTFYLFILTFMLLPGFNMYSQNSVKLDSGLVASYPFNGNANDESGNGNDGVVNGATLTTDRFGNANSAYYFDGISNYIKISNTKSINNNNFTYSCWVKVKNLPDKLNGGNIYEIGSVPYSSTQFAHALSLNNDYCNTVGWVISSGSIDGSRVLTQMPDSVLPDTGKWYNLVLTRSNNLLNYYINNQLMVSKPLNGKAPFYNNPLDIFIGTRCELAMYFNGTIDDIRIYNRALNSNEILALSQDNNIDLQKGLVAYYPFNGNAYDESGNGNDGVVNGATLTVDRFGKANSAYSFDGFSNIIITPDSSFYNKNYTYSFWYKPTQLPIQGYNFYLISIGGYSGDQCVGLVNSYPGLGTGFQCGGYSSATVTVQTASENLPVINNWYHIVAIRTTDSVKLYINDILVGQNTTNNMLPYYSMNGTSFTIGSRFNNTSFASGIIDEVRIYNRALNDSEVGALYLEKNTISIPKIDTVAGKTFTIPISTSKLNFTDSIISYQFKFTYDSSKIKYVSYDLTGTIAQGGTAIVNSSKNSMLKISYLTTTPLQGNGELIKLKFKSIDIGRTVPIISDFLFNTDTVYSIVNETINSAIKNYGDVDGNGYVQAYDAALTLQYSVGIDPLPGIYSMPWEPWLVKTANVDNTGNVTANDAGLILKYSADIISNFPAEKLKNAQENTADVNITLENATLIFRSIGNLIGFNLNVTDNFQVLGKPEILNDSIISAFNIDSSKYAIGLATAFAPVENSVFMKIPLKSTNSGNIGLDMIINTTSKTLSISTVTATPLNVSAGLTIYPNPAGDQLMINLPSDLNIATASIYNIEGKLLMTRKLNTSENSIDVKGLSSGLYHLQISGSGRFYNQRFIKK